MSDLAARLRSVASVYDQSYPPEVLGLEPNPRIVSLSPSSVSAAAGATTVTVTGQNFTATCVVEINQAAQTTTFVDADHLTVSYDPTVAGSVMFTVRDGTGESNSVLMNVTALQELSLSEQVGTWTVPEVQQYVLEHPTEAGDVLDAEQAGKARSTLTTWLEDFMSQTDPNEPTPQPDQPQPDQPQPDQPAPDNPDVEPV